MSLIQVATHWHDPAANRALLDEQLAAVPAEADLVLLPEMFSTGFTMASAEVAEPMSGPTVAWLRDRARARGVVLCGSVVIEEAGARYNRLLWAAPDGSLGSYDKRHCFRMAGEHEAFAAGTERRLFEVGGWRVLPFVCYDLRFPVWLRNRRDYDLLVGVANWPAARQRAWRTLLEARAIENQACVAGVNIVGTDGNGVGYQGGSVVFNAEGEPLAEADADPQILTARLDAGALADYRSRFPAWQDADDFRL